MCTPACALWHGVILLSIVLSAARRLYPNNADDELNVLIREEAFCNELDASIEALISRARLVGRGENLLASTEWYSARRAQWEELWQ